VKGSRRWLEKLTQSAGKLARTLNKDSLLDPKLKLQDALASLQPDLKALDQWLGAHDKLFSGCLLYTSVAAHDHQTVAFLEATIPP
ncbi:hypothetical protein, partial [Aeromonas salmonicida]|uniref:hypothetical protein n=1 Tax=Aeromonas salmonicida TaxID=645 RepID=UPI003D30F454